MTASEQIDNQIAEYSDWRGPLYAKLRKLILAADPELKEDFKWGTGVFVKKTNVCAIGVFKGGVKLNFFKGALVNDKKGLFNNGLESKNSRSIDFKEEGQIEEAAITDLVKQAAAL